MGKGKHHLKGPKKRTEEDDIRFENAFRNLLSDILKNESIDESECK